jgi:hypothetical protein
MANPYLAYPVVNGDMIILMTLIIPVRPIVVTSLGLRKSLGTCI